MGQENSRPDRYKHLKIEMIGRGGTPERTTFRVHQRPPGMGFRWHQIEETLYCSQDAENRARSMLKGLRTRGLYQPSPVFLDVSRCLAREESGNRRKSEGWTHKSPWIVYQNLLPSSQDTRMSSLVVFAHEGLLTASKGNGFRTYLQ